MNTAISLLTRLFDLLSPRKCPGCGRRLTTAEWPVCDSCMLGMPLTPFLHAPERNRMARVFWGVVPLERAAALFFYEAGTEPAMIIHTMKYHGQRQLAEQFGELLAKRLSAADFFQDIDAIIPVPLTRQRQRERGYNQSEYLARGISRVTGLPVMLHVLRRELFRGSQTHLSAVERWKNVEDAFRLTDGRELRGKHVLLVDDVMTTGATLTACATALTGIPDIRISVATLGYTR